MKKIIVHGVHRSGTSLTGNMLEKAGFWYADDEFKMPAQEDNPKGFWERTDVVELNDTMLGSVGLNWFTLVPVFDRELIASLRKKFDKQIKDIAAGYRGHDNWFLKDPRLSLTWPLWKNHLKPTHHIVVHRHPVSVAKSIQQRNGIPLQHALVFWYHQTRMIAKALKGEDNVTNLRFPFELDDEQEIVSTINAIGGRTKGLKKLTPRDYNSVFEKELLHHKKVDTELSNWEPAIEQAWLLAKNGDLDTLANLPEIELSIFTWGDLESRGGLVNIYEKSNRDLREHKGEIKLLVKKLDEKRIGAERVEIENRNLSAANEILKEESKKVDAERLKIHSESEKFDLINKRIIKENEIYREKNEKLIEDSRKLTENRDELKLSLLKISGELKRYMMTKRYIIPSVIGKALSRFKLVESRSLHHAFDMAKFGHTSDELMQVLPPISNRRLLLSALVRNPLPFIRELNFTRIFKGAWILLGKGETDRGVKQGLLRYYNSDFSVSEEIEIIEPRNFEETINEKIQFQIANKPKVSIVIPVYNKYETTFACLKSIRKHTDFSEISFEIVIADDHSTDQTADINEWVKGVRVVRGSENKGFLLNCNQAISKAKGEYIVLLNNDTNVQGEWLKELLNPIEKDSTIGITGSMFLYPDGRLQEAGGIIFSDASGWNYGRFDRPDKAEYNFARDVDYISGACLLFKKSLWDEIGGFDERFIPAYYEDSDFCFEVRKRGLRVRYIPTSKVVHFEGVSHGGDEGAGIKRYQRVNRKKFLDKWKKTLSTEHYIDDSAWFRARNHGKSRKTVLVIDHYVPMYDKDAGSRTIFMYIQLMIDSGHHVIFMGDNFYPHQPYTEELQRLGVEVLFGSHYKDKWFEWLSEHHQQIECIFFNRPHITSKYIDKIHTLEKPPRIAYYGLDLHFLRIQREKQFGIPNESGKSISAWREEELSIMRKSDVVFYPGEFEVKAVKSIDEAINVYPIPIYWYETDFLESEIVVNSSPNLLFIGGFGHPPNRDGLEWFIQKIFPLILNVYPHALLTVIGSKCPDEIFELTNDNICVLGEVSDPELLLAYVDARVAVVPLRYGAGVKGKVIESMSNGVPVVTTSVGAEGLPSIPEEYLAIGDTEKSFAKAVNELLKNTELCKEKSSLSYEILTKYFSRSAANQVIDRFFND